MIRSCLRGKEERSPSWCYSLDMNEEMRGKDRRFPQSSRPVLLWLGVMALVCGLGGCARDVSDSRIDVITLAEALQYHERAGRANPEVLFIDARRSVIFDEGHIRGAVNLRPNDVDLRAGTDPKLEAKEALVVYGQDPGSAVARAMSKRLIEAGYNTMLRRRVKFYAGGFNEWQATGLPVDRVEQAPSEEAQGPESADGG
jgi:rhodanese-related sulfurtransferase